MIRRNRYLILALAVGIGGWLVLVNVIPPTNVGDWIAATLTLVMCGVMLGAVGNIADDTFPARPRVPKPKVEKPGPSGLLSSDEFAKVCAEYATPKVDPEPDLPDALPEALMDEGLRASVPPSESVIDQAREEWCRSREARLFTTPSRPDPLWDRLKELERRRDHPTPTVADRSFDPHTHCPAGHIGWHFVGDKSIDGDRTLVARTCRYARCDRSWSEGAFTEDARDTERVTGRWTA